MPKRMLIDASHPEETRVVVLDGNKVEEFDFEAASRRPLKGNIYLAKVTRVEPSLQAAFVEYGGNRQGFLAFSEIHPDYYQIPVADRLALLADQSRRLMAEDDDGFEAVRTAKPQAQATKGGSDDAESHDEAELSDDNVIEGEIVEDDEEEEDDAEEMEASGDHSEHADDDREKSAAESEHGEAGSGQEGADEMDGGQEHASSGEGTTVPQEQARVEAEATGAPVPHQRREPRQRPPRRRQYKIQEVIKRRQVMLVQVVKEERGNKGASLTTYLSLAGRYCVLMPNTPRGGGISRKITSATDRRRLKSAAQSLELPEGMGLIIRTAGANRTKVEIKRDYEYLLRLWDSVRELTLKSNAPALVYEEGNLIKRAIRDLYNKDISEIVVDGEGGYRDAKEFMRMLMPSHAKNVKPYREPLPLFQSFGVEAQLDAMFSPTVTLKSGGYIVINQTEALVSIDVNSGKATREHSIEDTAYKTNLEAADEIGRQLRLRDLAGLIVIDFIDMEDSKNDRNVEKRIRDAVRNDRARVQIGKISQFGLLEMSRQRLRAGVVAGSTVTCPHCAGVGLVRSTESAALRLLRALDEEGQRQSGANFNVRAPEDIVIYTLNQKRREVMRIEEAYGLAIVFEPQTGMAGGSFDIQRTGTRTIAVLPKPAAASLEGTYFKEDAEEEEPDVTIVEAPAIQAARAETESSGFQTPGPREHNGDGQDAGKRRKRRRRRGGRGRGQSPAETGQPHETGQQQMAAESVSDGEVRAADVFDGSDLGESGESETGLQSGESPSPAQSDEAGEKQRRRRRRRGRRGRHRENEHGAQEPNSPQAIAASGDPFDAVGVDTAAAEIPGESSAEREPDLTAVSFGVAPNTPSTPQWSFTAEDSDSSAQSLSQPAREQVNASMASHRGEDATVSAHPQEESLSPASRAEIPALDTNESRRGGWWQRRFKG